MKLGLLEVLNFEYIYVLLHLFIEHVSSHTYKPRDTMARVWRSEDKLQQFILFFYWVLGFELRLSGLLAGTFRPTEPALPIYFINIHAIGSEQLGCFDLGRWS